MRAGVGVALVAAAFAALTLPRAAAAQEFQPPASGTGPAPTVSEIEVGLFGFSARGGIDVTSPASFVLGTTVDIAELFSPRVRLRPSLEVSSDGGLTRLHWAGEVIYRFEPDAAPAIPYLGLGLGHMTRCAGCVTLWPTVVMGFELHLHPSFNWLIEYHALDRLGRHRFLIGLATRDAGGF